MSRGKNCLPNCLETVFDSQLPSPKSSPKMPPKLPLPHRRGHFFLLHNYPCSEGNCEAIERQKLSRGNFCPGTSRCLAGPTGQDSLVNLLRRRLVITEAFGDFLTSLGQKSCRTKVSRIFRIFVPNFCPEFCSEFFPNFSCFVSWETENRKNSPKIPAIFQCKIPRQTQKKVFTKLFRRAGKVRLLN